MYQALSSYPYPLPPIYHRGSSLPVEPSNTINTSSPFLAPPVESPLQPPKHSVVSHGHISSIVVATLYQRQHTKIDSHASPIASSYAPRSFAPLLDYPTISTTSRLLRWSSSNFADFIRPSTSLISTLTALTQSVQLWNIGAKQHRSTQPRI